MTDDEPLKSSIPPGIQELYADLCRIARLDLLENFPDQASRIHELHDADGTDLVNVSTFKELIALITTGRPPFWYTAFTALFDVIVTAGKVKLALGLYRDHGSEADAAKDGALLEYHGDAWMWHMFALCEKAAHLLDSIYRDIYGQKKGNWSELLAARKATIAEKSRALNKRRVPTTHKRGQVSVYGEEERVWEVYAIFDEPLTTILGKYHEATSPRRTDRYEMLRSVTLSLLTTLAEQFRGTAADLGIAFPRGVGM